MYYPVDSSGAEADEARRPVSNLTPVSTHPHTPFYGHKDIDMPQKGDSRTASDRDWLGSQGAGTLVVEGIAGVNSWTPTEDRKED